VDTPENTININVKRLTTGLFITIVILSFLSIAGQVAKFFLAEKTVFGFLHDFRLFNFDFENNIPTWYSSFQMLIAASLMALIASWKVQIKDKYRIHWSILGILLLLMSLDETASIHERFTQPLQSSLKLGGLLHFSWLILGLAIVAGFIIFYLKFFFSLDRKTKVKILIAGAIYLAGALGSELIGGVIFETYGDSVQYAIVTTVEEMLELFGIALLINTLLGYIKFYVSRSYIHVT
jgi:hypothetical protein